MALVTSHHPSPVYLVDFSVYQPPEEYKVDRAKSEEAGKSWSMYSPEMRDFMVKVVQRSGLSQKGTYLPPAIHPQHAPQPQYDMATALVEAKQVMTGAVGKLLAKTGVRPCDVDILVTNCSIFCPTPSLTSMLVNHFKFRSDIQTYHLGGVGEEGGRFSRLLNLILPGMGCGNGVSAIGLTRDLLQARPNSVAVFVPAEITTYAFYPGVHKQYMVANCIFRMGGAAIMMSNKKQYARTAKYQLQHTARVHTGQSDESYGCMSWGPDPDGVNGVYLGKNVASEAGKALKMALTAITPKILTWGQYAEAATSLLANKVGLSQESYVPNYTKSMIDHFAIHAGGYAVLKAVQAGMSLPAHTLLPSFAALRDYGNTSCSTTWYVMAYMESIGSVNRGQHIMQIGMGGGMKVGINVWRALNNNASIHPAWVHLASNPLTEADLPRSIEPVGGADAAHMATGAAAPEEAKPLTGAGKAVARKLTVEVQAMSDETDEELADRAH